MSEGLGGLERHQLQEAAEAVHRGLRGEVAEPFAFAQGVHRGRPHAIAVQREEPTEGELGKQARALDRVAAESDDGRDVLHGVARPSVDDRRQGQLAVHLGPHVGREVAAAEQRVAERLCVGGAPVAATPRTRAVVTSIDGSVESEGRDLGEP